MLSLFIEKLDNGYVVKVSLNVPELFDEEPPRGRFFGSPAAMADGMPTLVLEAVDAAEGAVALYRQRLAEEQKHWAAQRSAGASGSILGNKAAQSRGHGVGSALPPGFRGVDDLRAVADEVDAREERFANVDAKIEDQNGGDYAPLPEEKAVRAEPLSIEETERLGVRDPSNDFREDDGA